MDPLNCGCVHVVGNITTPWQAIGVATNTRKQCEPWGINHGQLGIVGSWMELSHHGLGWIWDISGGTRHIRNTTKHIADIAVSPHFVACSHANKHAPLWVRLQQLSQSRWSGDLQRPLGGSRCGDRRWLSHIVTKCHQCYPVIRRSCFSMNDLHGHALEDLEGMIDALDKA